MKSKPSTWVQGKISRPRYVEFDKIGASFIAVYQSHCEKDERFSSRAFPRMLSPIILDFFFSLKFSTSVHALESCSKILRRNCSFAKAKIHPTFCPKSKICERPVDISQSRENLFVSLEKKEKKKGKESNPKPRRFI